MARECIVCHKTSMAGRQYKRRGAAKLGGGAGRKITGKSARRFKPNLQRIKILFDGTVQRVLVCTRCIKAGKITKA